MGLAMLVVLDGRDRGSTRRGRGLGHTIVAIDMIADPEHLAELDVVPAWRSAWLSDSS